MHRDKKVGLALAILLCSIVGAFFFREDSPRGTAPELKDPKKLDEAIALRDKPPYPDADSSTKSRPNNSRRTWLRSVKALAQVVGRSISTCVFHCFCCNCT